MLLLSFTTQGL
uniref:Uncharacterized protein n=1 Tax=Moniliophthora roreri TaxID=221103 RepID=A0A0W0FZ79_MONRR